MANRRVPRVHAFVVALLVLAAVPSVWAGPHGDALGKCLVSSTTQAEKTTLVRWMFAVMALHPDVQSSSAVTPAQRTAISRDTAKIFQRLLTESCASQTRAAIRYEGTATIEASFSQLGQVAAQELFAHPKVAAGLTEFASYIDESKLKALGAPAAK